MLIVDRKRSHASHLRPDCQCLAERERGLHPALVVWSSSCHLTWGSCLRERRVGCSGLNVSWKRRSCVGHTREDDGSGGLSKQPEHPAALHFSPLCRRARAIQWDVVSDAVDGWVGQGGRRGDTGINHDSTSSDQIAANSRLALSNSCSSFHSYSTHFGHFPHFSLAVG